MPQTIGGSGSSLYEQSHVEDKGQARPHHVFAHLASTIGRQQNRHLVISV